MAVSISLRIKPSLPSQFFCYCSSFCLWHVIQFKYIVYLLYDILSSLYSYSAFQLIVGWGMISMPILGTKFYILSLVHVLTTAMACTTTLAASTDAWAIACVIMSYSVALLDFLCIYLEVVFVRLPHFGLPNLYLLMLSASVCLAETFTHDTM